MGVFMFMGKKEPSTQAFSSRSHNLARNFIGWRHDNSHQVESREREENAWALGWEKSTLRGNERVQSKGNRSRLHAGYGLMKMPRN